MHPAESRALEAAQNEVQFYNDRYTGVLVGDLISSLLPFSPTTACSLANAINFMTKAS
jgi:hypothetical protein